jgi:hypothetical protein
MSCLRLFIQYSRRRLILPDGTSLELINQPRGSTVSVRLFYRG